LPAGDDAVTAADRANKAADRADRAADRAAGYARVVKRLVDKLGLSDHSSEEADEDGFERTCERVSVVVGKRVSDVAKAGSVSPPRTNEHLGEANCRIATGIRQGVVHSNSQAEELRKRHRQLLQVDDTLDSTGIGKPINHTERMHTLSVVVGAAMGARGALTTWAAAQGRQQAVVGGGNVGDGSAEGPLDVVVIRTAKDTLKKLALRVHPDKTSAAGRSDVLDTLRFVRQIVASLASTVDVGRLVGVLGAGISSVAAARGDTLDPKDAATVVTQARSALEALGATRV
jgi:hypothetical protein